MERLASASWRLLIPAPQMASCLLERAGLALGGGQACALSRWLCHAEPWFLHL